MLGKQKAALMLGALVGACAAGAGAQGQDERFEVTVLTDGDAGSVAGVWAPGGRVVVFGRERALRDWPASAFPLPVPPLGPRQKLVFSKSGTALGRADYTNPKAATLDVFGRGRLGVPLPIAWSVPPLAGSPSFKLSDDGRTALATSREGHAPEFADAKTYRAGGGTTPYGSFVTGEIDSFDISGNGERVCLTGPGGTRVYDATGRMLYEVPGPGVSHCAYAGPLLAAISAGGVAFFAETDASDPSGGRVDLIHIGEVQTQSLPRHVAFGGPEGDLAAVVLSARITLHRIDRQGRLVTQLASVEPPGRHQYCWADVSRRPGPIHFVAGSIEIIEAAKRGTIGQATGLLELFAVPPAAIGAGRPLPPSVSVPLDFPSWNWMTPWVRFLDDGGLDVLAVCRDATYIVEWGR